MGKGGVNYVSSTLNQAKAKAKDKAKHRSRTYKGPSSHPHTPRLRSAPSPRQHSDSRAGNMDPPKAEDGKKDPDRWEFTTQTGKVRNKERAAESDKDEDEEEAEYDPRGDISFSWAVDGKVVDEKAVEAKKDGAEKVGVKGKLKTGRTPWYLRMKKGEMAWAF